MPEIMIAIDSVCSATLLIVLYGIIFENPSKDKKSIAFFVLDVGAIIALFVDLLSWILNGVMTVIVLRYVLDFLAMISILIIATFYLIYIMEVIKEKKAISKNHKFIAIGIAVVTIVAILVLTILGFTFNYDSAGNFETGSLYFLSSLVGILLVTYAESLVIASKKSLGTHDTITLLVYFLFPLLAFILSFVTSVVELGLTSITLSLLVIYVLLQSKHYSTLKIREKYLKVMSFQDSLTGLLNRRGYNNALDYSDSNCDVGVIFSDVNGLKYINDTQGHDAGDAYLIKYANILRNAFPMNSVFRISGDEFVVIIREIDQKKFEHFLKDYKKSIDANDNIASYGSSFGKYENILSLINEAEKAMYVLKREYHSNNPQRERREIY